MCYVSVEYQYQIIDNIRSKYNIVYYCFSNFQIYFEIMSNENICIKEIIKIGSYKLNNSFFGVSMIRYLMFLNNDIKLSLSNNYGNCIVNFNFDHIEHCINSINHLKDIFNKKILVIDDYKYFSVNNVQYSTLYNKKYVIDDLVFLCKKDKLYLVDLSFIVIQYNVSIDFITKIINNEFKSALAFYKESFIMLTFDDNCDLYLQAVSIKLHEVFRSLDYDVKKFSYVYNHISTFYGNLHDKVIYISKIFPKYNFIIPSCFAHYQFRIAKDYINHYDIYKLISAYNIFSVSTINFYNLIILLSYIYDICAVIRLKINYTSSKDIYGIKYKIYYIFSSSCNLVLFTYINKFFKNTDIHIFNDFVMNRCLQFIKTKTSNIKILNFLRNYKFLSIIHFMKFLSLFNYNIDIISYIIRISCLIASFDISNAKNNHTCINDQFKKYLYLINNKISQYIYFSSYNIIIYCTNTIINNIQISKLKYDDACLVINTLKKVIDFDYYIC